MRKVVRMGVVLGGLAMMWGCDSGGRGVTALESAPPAGGATVTNARESTLELGRPAEIDWVIVGGHRQAGTGRLELTVDIDGERYDFVMGRADRGVEFELVAGDDERFGLLLGHDGAGALISEWTNTDRLDVLIEEQGGGRVAETYQLNGNSRTWVVRRHAEVPGHVAEEFEGFMPETSSLNENVVGHRLIALITDPDLPGELERLGFADVDVLAHDTLRVPDWIMLTCTAAAACTLVKCELGGPANPVCVMCAGATFVCVLVILSYYL